MSNSKRKGHTRLLGAGTDFQGELSEPSSRRGPLTSVCISCGAKVVFILTPTGYKPMDLLTENAHVCVVRKP